MTVCDSKDVCVQHLGENAHKPKKSKPYIPPTVIHLTLQINTHAKVSSPGENGIVTGPS